MALNHRASRDHMLQVDTNQIWSARRTTPCGPLNEAPLTHHASRDGMLLVNANQPRR